MVGCWNACPRPFATRLASKDKHEPERPSRSRFTVAPNSLLEAAGSIPVAPDCPLGNASGLPRSAHALRTGKARTSARTLAPAHGFLRLYLAARGDRNGGHSHRP